MFWGLRLTPGAYHQPVLIACNPATCVAHLLQALLQLAMHYCLPNKPLNSHLRPC